MNEHLLAFKELEKALKYRERELEGFQRKLILLGEQKTQYEQELIPQFEAEIEEIKKTMEYLKLSIDLDLPF